DANARNHPYWYAINPFAKPTNFTLSTTERIQLNDAEYRIAEFMDKYKPGYESMWTTANDWFGADGIATNAFVAIGGVTEPIAPPKLQVGVNGIVIPQNLIDTQIKDNKEGAGLNAPRPGDINFIGPLQARQPRPGVRPFQVGTQEELAALQLP